MLLAVPQAAALAFVPLAWVAGSLLWALRVLGISVVVR
jgi:hypothetical protein